MNPSPMGSARFLEIKRHQQSPASAGFGVKVVAHMRKFQQLPHTVCSDVVPGERRSGCSAERSNEGHD